MPNSHKKSMAVSTYRVSIVGGAIAEYQDFEATFLLDIELELEMYMEI